MAGTTGAVLGNCPEGFEKPSCSFLFYILPGLEPATEIGKYSFPYTILILLQKLIPPKPCCESAATHLAFSRPHLMQASCLEMLKMTSCHFYLKNAAISSADSATKAKVSFVILQQYDFVQ